MQERSGLILSQICKFLEQIIFAPAMKKAALEAI
jgi:hypothetical protein